MRNFLPGILQFILIAFSFILLFGNTASAQTPGLIYKPATNGGNKILDPDGDGYVSLTNAGFPGVNMDEGSSYSEIPYKPFPVFMDEPLSDLGTGAKYGHTDYAPKGTGSSPLAAYFDGTNFLFRVRLGGQSTASKGYSILIDANSTLNSTGSNPGFEYEIVLCTNFDVRVYYHGDNTNANPVVDAAGPVIFNGSVDQYSQKAIASSQGGGDADYFYDFYIPLSALKGAIVPITASTGLRMTGVTVTSARSGLFGTASDIGGIDDAKYNGNLTGALKDIINSYIPTTPTGVQTDGFPQIKAKAPVVNGPIYTSSTSITGYSVEAAGSSISVYQGTTLLGTTTVNANGAWTLSSLSTTLITNQIITATVKPDNKTVSGSSEPVTVRTIQSSCTAEPPIFVGHDLTKAFYVTTFGSGTLRIFGSDNITRTYTVTTTGEATQYCQFGDGRPGSIPAGTYYATFTPTNGSCVSESSNVVCFIRGNGQGNSDATTILNPPKITTSSLTVTSTVLNGTTNYPNVEVLIFKNGAQIKSIFSSASANSDGTYNWTTAINDLRAGDILYAKVTAYSSSCGTNLLSSKSGSITVADPSTPTVSTAPKITGSYCGTTTTLTGTSSEAPGTTIRIYNAGSLAGSTTVNAFGSWIATGLSLPGGAIITATSIAIGKTESAASAAKTIGTTYSGTLPAITSPLVTEGDTHLKGTAPAGTMITLYINGEPYVNTSGTPITVTTNSSGIWEFTSTSSPSTALTPFDLYAGAKLTVTAKSSGSFCESSHSTADVVVQCKAPNQLIQASLTQTTFCPGAAATIKLNTSEADVIYNIYIRAANETDAQAALFSYSELGTGKELLLETRPLSTTDNGKIIFVKTVKVGAKCEFKIGGNLTVGVYDAVPNNFELTATPTSVCSNNTTIISVTAAAKDYTYQLINNTTKAKLGNPVIRTADGTFSFPAVNVPSTTDFSIIITRTVGGCVAENTNLNKVTITTTGPTVTQAVTPLNSAACINSSVSFSFNSESGYTYTLVDKDTNTEIGTPKSSTTGSITLSTGQLTTAGTKNYRIKVVNGASCTTYLTSEPRVTVTNDPGATVSAGPNQTVCGTSVTLQGSDPLPGAGTWSIVSGPGGEITTPGSATTTVKNLTRGTYIFRWTVRNTCGSVTQTASEVTVKVNCDATYVVGTTKFFDEYKAGDVLVTFFDELDGGITSFTPVSGTKPAGTAFSIEDGKLVLKVVSPPAFGSDHKFTIRTTDANGGVTDNQVIIRMYSRTQAPGGVTPLPVELIYFKAAVNKKQVVLNWETASEKDNQRFDVQRSANGVDYKTIGSVLGNGTSSIAIKYNFTDSDPVTGTSYYRLKQVDFDGTITYSRLVSIKLQGYSDGELHTVQAFPNPFTTELNIKVYAAIAGNADLMVLDLQGRTVFSKTIIIEPGENSYTLQLPNCDKGLYFLKVIGNGINSTTKLIKN